MSITLQGTQFRIGLPFVGLLLAYALLGLGLEALIAFLSVAAHEAAHALVASAYDLETTSVELTPFGGVARLGGLMEQDPYVETSVALAGPASSFLLAGLSAVLWRSGALPPYTPSLLVDINLLLGLVNLVPVLPLDGGRVARANLSKRVGYRTATKVIANIGRIVALFTGALGAYFWLTGKPIPNLLVYAVFGYLFAGKEQQNAALTSLSLLMRRKENLAKQGVIVTQSLTALSTVTLDKVSRAFSSRHYSIVSVLSTHHMPMGSLSESEIVERILSGNGQATLGEILAQKTL